MIPTRALVAFAAAVLATGVQACPAPTPGPGKVQSFHRDARGCLLVTFEGVGTFGVLLPSGQPECRPGARR